MPKQQANPNQPNLARPLIVAGLPVLAALLAAVAVAVLAALLDKAVILWLLPVIFIALAAALWRFYRVIGSINHEYLELDRTVQAYLLEKLISGETLTEKEQEHTFYEGPPHYYAVLLISALDDSVTEPITSERPFFYEEDKYLRDALTQSMDNYCTMYFIPRANGLFVVACLPELNGRAIDQSARDAVAKLCSLTENCIRHVFEESGLVLGAVVSTVYDSTELLPDAYREATELESYAELMGDKSPVKNAYEHLDAPQELSARRARMDLEKQYLGFLAAREYTRAGQILDSLIDAELSIAARKPQMLKDRLVMRLEQMFNSLSISMEDYDSAAYLAVERFHRLTDAATVSEMREQTAAVVSAIADYAEHTTASNSGKVAEALDFIRENYANPNMGATLLSEHLEISTSYLSRIVKQATGVGIVDCIHEVRIKAAKQLLTETELSVDEIAERVGFSNRWTLTRSFKRYEGTTPSAYRDSQRAAKRA